MLTHNESVADGKANGSRALAERVVLKVGETASTAQLSNGVNVSVVLASQVSHVELRHCNSRTVPPSFLLRAKEYTFDVKFPTPTAISSTTGNERELLGLKASQFPFISNTATTGHKLQGATIDKLFVHKWYFCRNGRNPSSRPSNWPYVVLSRVRTIDGLIIHEKLPEDLTLYRAPQELRSMLRKFQGRMPEDFSVDDISDILYGVARRL